MNNDAERNGTHTYRSMCSDLVYVVLFPQLLMVVHFKKYCNTYGSLAAYAVAFFFRITGGESMLGLPPFIRYPGYDDENEKQLFPFRTMAMLLSLLTLASVSFFFKYVYLIRHLHSIGLESHSRLWFRFRSPPLPCSRSSRAPDTYLTCIRAYLTYCYIIGMVITIRYRDSIHLDSQVGIRKRTSGPRIRLVLLYRQHTRWRHTGSQRRQTGRWADGHVSHWRQRSD